MLLAHWCDGKPNDVRSNGKILAKEKQLGFSNFGHLRASERPLSHARKNGPFVVLRPLKKAPPQ